MSTAPALIALDWGTTALRAVLMDGAGRVLERRASGEGLMAVKDGAFADILLRTAGAWGDAHGPLPVLLSGMVGSRQGWAEAPYVACPADFSALAQGLLLLPQVAPFGPIAIVPGLITHAHGVPDVIRGEEVEILGALAQGCGDGLFVLPGTHSKWVEVEAGRITAFTTYMTGEVFAALKGHTILGRMMADGDVSPAGFRRGVEAASSLTGPGGLLHLLFSVRTLALTGALDANDSADYLSGLLIGAELSTAAPGKRPFTVIANAALAARYEEAARLLGNAASLAPADCGAAGQFAVAKAAGLVA